MTIDPEADRRDLHDARDAVAAARTSAIETDQAVEYMQKANSGLITIVRANGFLDKFRSIIQGG